MAISLTTWRARRLASRNRGRLWLSRARKIPLDAEQSRAACSGSRDLGLHRAGTIAMLQRDVLELLISSKALIARQARRSRLANSGERVKRKQAELPAYHTQRQPRAL